MGDNSKGYAQKDRTALIKASALNRFYGGFHAVNNVDLTLYKGEVLGLLGPNGAGKSSTMQMLTGNISPSSGEIVINGVDLLNEPKAAKHFIGYLPEQPPIYRDMTSVEFLNYCAMLHDVSKAKIKSAVDNALGRCGLADVSGKLIGNLSKGYQQRVGIAQAILHQPDVVILDEPTVGLDPIQITQIRELIRELGSDHSVILSTHILPEVQAVCDRVQIINRGKTVFADSLEKLTRQQGASSVLVVFENEVDKTLLDNLDGIETVMPIGARRYQLSISPSVNEFNPANIYKLAVEQGWVIKELTPQKNTLEQIFMGLIHSDAIALTEKQLNKQKEAA